MEMLHLIYLKRYLKRIYYFILHKPMKSEFIFMYLISILRNKAVQIKGSTIESIFWN
jgi:hypothetical protein